MKTQICVECKEEPVLNKKRGLCSACYRRWHRKAQIKPEFDKRTLKPFCNLVKWFLDEAENQSNFDLITPAEQMLIVQSMREILEIREGSDGHSTKIHA